MYCVLFRELEARLLEAEKQGKELQSWSVSHLVRIMPTQIVSYISDHLAACMIGVWREEDAG